MGGGEVQGGKREPCNLEASKSIIFSWVVNARSDMGSLSSFAFWTDLVPLLLGLPDGGTRTVPGPVMMNI